MAGTTTSWFIDPINGNDNDLGTSGPSAVPHPLKTHEELRRRIGDSIIEGDVEVNLLNDFPSDNPVIVDFTLGPNAQLTYRGIKPLKTLHTGTFTGVVPIDATSNQAQEVEDASLGDDWGPSGLVNSGGDLPDGSLRRIRLTGGAHAGAIAYACKDRGGRRARTSPFGIPANLQQRPPRLRLVGPAPNDPFVVESGFALIDSLVVDIRISPIGTPVPPGKIHLFFVDLELNPNEVHRHQARALAEPVDGGPATIMFTGCGVGRLSPQYANKVAFDFCRLGGTRQYLQGTLVQLGGCCCVGEVVVFEGARITAFAHTIFQGNALRLQGLARLGDVAFFDADGVAGLQVEQNGTALVEPLIGGGHAVYGNGHNGTGAKVRAGGCIIYDARDPTDHHLYPSAMDAGLTVTGAGGDVDVAGTRSSWGAIRPDLAVAGKRAAVARND